MGKVQMRRDTTAPCKWTSRTQLKRLASSEEEEPAVAERIRTDDRHGRRPGANRIAPRLAGRAVATAWQGNPAIALNPASQPMPKGHRWPIGLSLG